MLLITILPVAVSTAEEQYPVMISQPERPEGFHMRTPNQMDKTSGPLPSQFTWMDWVTPARYQDMCGSCWAFAAIACIEAQYNIAYNNHMLDPDLSEQYVLACLPDAGSCDGGWTDLALEYIMSEEPIGNDINGIVSEDCMPYLGHGSYCHEKCPDWQDHLYPIWNYGVYDDLTPTDINFMKTQLKERGPLATYIMATPNFISYYKDGAHGSPTDIYEDGTWRYAINHAILLLGWKDDPTVSGGGYWICKNSWGQDWGYNGFFNIAYGQLNVGETIHWVEVLGSFGDADFVYIPEQPLYDDTIQFTGGSDHNISEYWWDFGDGYYSDVEEPVHCYYEPGIYEVTLTITDTGGNQHSTTKAINILEQPLPNLPPTADFIYVVDSNVVQFTEQSYDTDGYIKTYLWNFGDGTSSNDRNPSHTYSSGAYTITLTVYDDDGSTDSISKNVQIQMNGDEVLDQSLETSGLPYPSPVWNQRWQAQEFKTTVNILTKVKMYLKKNNFDGDVTIYIRKTLSGNNLAECTVSGNALSEQYKWITFDFEDISVTKGAKYHIICKTDEGNYRNCLYCGAIKNSEYTRGNCAISGNSGASWSIFTYWDFVFRTYGIR